MNISENSEKYILFLKKYNISYNVNLNLKYFKNIIDRVNLLYNKNTNIIVNNSISYKKKHINLTYYNRIENELKDISDKNVLLMAI